MNDEVQQRCSRPGFRWLAGITCSVFLLLAIICAFPGFLGSNERGQLWLAFLFALGAVYFGSVAATGRFRKRLLGAVLFVVAVVVVWHVWPEDLFWPELKGAADAPPVPVRIGENVWISREHESFGLNECVIAADPSNANRLFAASVYWAHGDGQRGQRKGRSSIREMSCVYVCRHRRCSYLSRGQQVSPGITCPASCRDQTSSSANMMPETAAGVVRTLPEVPTSSLQLPPESVQDSGPPVVYLKEGIHQFHARRNRGHRDQQCDPQSVGGIRFS